MSKKPVPTNLVRLLRSRKRLHPGDIFVYKFPRRPFGFGRVIRTDVIMAPASGLLLLYFYKAFSKDKNAIPRLDKSDLLMQPKITNATPWTQGFFQTVASRPLSAGDAYRRHAFHCVFDDCYYDEHNVRLKRRLKCWGEWGMGNCYSLDDRLSIALGIPLSPRVEELW